jgi:hypothetical protein
MSEARIGVVAASTLFSRLAKVRAEGSGIRGLRPP